MKSKVLSLSAISAAFIALTLTVGAYLEIADLFAIVISSVFVLLPLYLSSYLGSTLAYLAGGVIAFLFSGFNIMSIVFPSYFAFFGLYPIVRAKMTDKKTNKYLSLIIGLIWCVAAAYGIYFYYTAVIGGLFDGLPQWIMDYAIVFVGVVAVIFYFIYDRFITVIRTFIDRYLGKIVK